MAGFTGSDFCGGVPIGDANGYPAETINYIGCQVSALLRKYTELEQLALEAAAELEAQAKEAMDAIQNAGSYRAETDGVPQKYKPYTGPVATEPDFSEVVPPPPEMPEAEAILGPCEVDSIFTKAKNRIARTNRGAEHNALYQAGKMGIGMSDPSIHMALKQVEYENRASTIEAALEQVVQQGQWEREDIVSILNLQAQIYAATANGSAQYLNAETQRFLARMERHKTYIQEQAEARGWSELELKNILEQADKTIAYALEQTKAVVAAQESASQAVLQFLATMAQGMAAAANLGLSGSGSYGGSESTSTTYSYSGEVASP